MGARAALVVALIACAVSVYPRAASASALREYVGAKGETFYCIQRRCGCSTAACGRDGSSALARANPRKADSMVGADGEVILVPACCSQADCNARPAVPCPLATPKVRVPVVRPHGAKKDGGEEEKPEEVGAGAVAGAGAGGGRPAARKGRGSSVSSRHHAIGVTDDGRIAPYHVGVVVMQGDRIKTMNENIQHEAEQREKAHRHNLARMLLDQLKLNHIPEAPATSTCPNAKLQSLLESYTTFDTVCAVELRRTAMCEDALAETPEQDKECRQSVKTLATGASLCSARIKFMAQAALGTSQGVEPLLAGLLHSMVTNAIDIIRQTCDIAVDEHLALQGKVCGAYLGRPSVELELNDKSKIAGVRVLDDHAKQPSKNKGTPKTSDLFLTDELACRFDLMRQAAAEEGVVLKITSGVRSYESQQYLWKLYKAGTGNEAAFPGRSNHGVGRALDLSVNTGSCYAVKGRVYTPSGCRDSPAYMWLLKNAGKFGFMRTVKSEPHHWVTQGPFKADSPEFKQPDWATPLEKED